MTARTPRKSGPVGDEEAQALMADAGKGFENQTFLDGAPWLERDAPTQDFVLAINAIDNAGDQRELVSLLKSDVAITKAARWYLADLLERHVLKRKQGKPRIPAYDRSLVQWRLEEAGIEYRAADRRTNSREADIAAIALNHLVPWGLFEEHEWIDRLTDHLDGKRRQSRAVKRRTPPPS